MAENSKVGIEGNKAEIISSNLIEDPKKSVLVVKRYGAVIRLNPRLSIKRNRLPNGLENHTSGAADRHVGRLP